MGAPETRKAWQATLDFLAEFDVRHAAGLYLRDLFNKLQKGASDALTH